jgi:nicotinate-nucleotide adenylyltransferase
MAVGKQFNVGIIGGNFDPIHNGHLMIANEASEQCEFAQVLFCPYRNSPREEDREVTGSQTRMMMIELAVKDIPKFQISLVELDREGPSYTVDTLEELSENNPNWNLHFVIGSDNLKEFHTWKEPGRILELARLFVARRDENPTKVPREVKELIQEKGSDRIVFQSEEGPQFRVSSTMIRQRRREHKSIEFLVPNEVQDYIKSNDLYEKRRKL